MIYPKYRKTRNLLSLTLNYIFRLSSAILSDLLFSRSVQEIVKSYREHHNNSKARILFSFSFIRIIHFSATVGKNGKTSVFIIRILVPSADNCRGSSFINYSRMHICSSLNFISTATATGY